MPGGFGTRLDRAFWPVAAVLLVVALVPSLSVLWFMNEAIRNQREAARQKLSDAYRGQLALALKAMEPEWRKRTGGTQAGGSAQVSFREIVRSGIADSAAVLDGGGQVLYPAATSAMRESEPDSAEWMKARSLEQSLDIAGAAKAYALIAASAKNPSVRRRAIRAEVRCLVKAGQKEQAIWRVLAAGTDVPPDTQLLALQLMKPGDRRFTMAVERLEKRLNNYADSTLPGAERLFLMHELRSAFPGADFPTLEAEELAAKFVDSEPKPWADGVVRASAVPGLWKSSPDNGRIVLLHRTGTISSFITQFLAAQQLPPDFSVAVLPPAAAVSPGAQSVPAGSLFPGWHISTSFGSGKGFQEFESRQRRIYIWTGVLIIATIALSAAAAGWVVRRRVRLAELKADLASTVSHELKTPVSSIGVLVDTLLEDSRFDARKAREYLELIASENARLRHLIENFLTFGRLERNTYRFEFTPTDPASIVRDSVTAACERFNSPELRADVEIAAGLPMVRADRAALVTVLLNLLDNAIKYSPGEKWAGVKVYAENGTVRFEVTDHGIGIAPREAKKIFRKFYQVDRRLSREAGGCGLGLSIAEFIVKAHRGSIAVRSEQGAGSTFTVSLPCLPVAERTVA